MPTISLVMIVKNEGRNLPRALDSAKDWVNEIIILDSGSTDNTEEIAKQYGAKFYQNKHWPGFGKQRQLAQQYVTSDYTLWLDADEVISNELKNAIIQAVNADHKDFIYKLPRLSEVFGRKIKHSGWYPDFVIRLYPTALTRYNDSLVHEKVEIPQGATLQELKGDLDHYTYDSLHHYLVKSAGYAKAWADQREKAGKKATIFQGITHAIGCFMKMYILKRGFLDGKEGFLLAILSAHSTFVKYADLWIRTKNK